MNSNFFENPLFLLVLILLSALSSWLMKRRQRNQPKNLPAGVELPPTPRAQERASSQLDWQNALRQLLGGASTPQAPPPPIAGVIRATPQDSQVQHDEERFQPQQRSMDYPREADEKLRQPADRFAECSRHQAALSEASAARLKSIKRQDLRHIAPSNKPDSNKRAVAGPHWREPQTVRWAFVASLVFAPPKGLKTGLRTGLAFPAP